MRILLLVLILTLFAFDATFAQWRPSGPGGGSVSSIAAGDTALYAITTFDVYRLGSGASEWRQIWNGDNILQSIATFGNVILVGTNSGMVYRSRYGGLGWERFEIIDPGFIPVSSLVVRGSTVFALMINQGWGPPGGVFRSGDSGATWKRVSSELDYMIMTIAVSDSFLFAGGSGGLMRSADDGATWKPVRSGDSVDALAKIRGALLVGNSGGIFRSTDDGNTWSEATAGSPRNATLVAFAATGSMIFAMTTSEIYHSSDEGVTWVRGAGEIPARPLASIASWRDTIYAGASDGGGIFRSADVGAHWTPVTAGMNDARVAAWRTDGSTTWAATAAGLYRSSDAGERWEHAGLRGGVLSFMRHGKHLVAGGDGWGIRRSSDDGANWEPVGSGLSEEGVVRGLASDGARIYAGTDSGVFVSSDAGASWQASNEGIQASQRNVVALAGGDGVLYRGDDWGGSIFGFYRSIDSGDKWSKITLDETPITALVAHGERAWAATLARNIYRTVDRGATWSDVSINLIGPSRMVHTLFYHDGLLFAGTDYGIYYSSDQGGSWQSANSSLLAGSTIESGSVLGGDLVVAARGRGVWRRALSQLVVSAVRDVATSEGAVVVWSMPNPFSGSVTVGYSAPSPGMVRLSLHDHLGRRIRTLVDEVVERGEHSVRLDAEDLPSGIYFCRIDVAGNAATMPMVLAR